MAYYSYVQRDYKTLLELLQEIENILDLNTDPYLAYFVYYRYYSIYTKWENIEKTDYYTRKLIKLAQDQKSYHQLADAYIAKSFAMTYLYKLNHTQAYKDSIKYYREKAAFLDLKYPNKIGQPTQSIAYLNLADYYNQELEEGNLSLDFVKDSIIKYTTLANLITPEFDYYYGVRGNVLNLKAQLYKANGEIKKAESYLLEAYNKLNNVENDDKSFYALTNVSGELYDFYTSIEDYKNANHFLKEYMAYNDSVYNHDKIRDINELEVKYENQRIKDKNLFLEDENEWKTVLNYLLLAVFLLVCSVLYYVRKNSLKKLSLQRLRERSILKEKEKMVVEAILEKEKQKRLAAEQRTLLLEKEKLQKEAMSKSLQIERKNKLLNEIREKLSGEKDINEIQNTIRKEDRINTKVNKTFEDFKAVNPMFFKRLREMSKDTLSALDIKYCAYFLLGLETKEIANIFNVEAKSVRMVKYRIKQKLNLPKEQSLESFLSQL